MMYVYILYEPFEILFLFDVFVSVVDCDLGLWHFLVILPNFYGLVNT